MKLVFAATCALFLLSIQSAESEDNTTPDADKQATPSATPLKREPGILEVEPNNYGTRERSPSSGEQIQSNQNQATSGSQAATGTQTSANENFVSYSYPNIKWKLKQIRTVPGARIEVSTTNEIMRSYAVFCMVKYSITLTYAPRPRLLDLKFVNDKGEELFEINVKGDQFQPVKDHKEWFHAEGKCTIVREELYKEARDFLVDFQE